MAITVGKLYSTLAHSSANIGQTARLELKGTVNLIIYGSEDLQTSVANMTPVSETITDDFYYPLDTLPTYIAFIGTADRINVGGYDLTEIDDIA
jgi:hypothetical protein